MEKSSHDLPPEDQDADEDLEILDRILHGDQPEWDEPEEELLCADEDEDFYIFEDEDEAQDGPEPIAAPIQIAGRFAVVSELSKDERGTLYATLDSLNEGHSCWLRVLDPAWMGAAPVEDLLARADQVRSASSALDHSSILPFEEAGLSEDGLIWLSSVAPQGESLLQLAQRSGALSPVHALEIMRQTLAGLEHAAARGLCHGSLDAASIYLAPKLGWTEENPFAVGVRIGEIGLANLTPNGAHGRADLLACASLLAELLTGEPFDPASSTWDSRQARAKEIGMSEALWTLLDTALAEEPDDRYQSAKEFRNALERVPEYRFEAPGKKRSMLSNALLLIAICAVMFGTKERWWPAAKSEAKSSLFEDSNQAQLEALREQAKLLEEEKLRAEAAALELATAREVKLALESEIDKERAQKDELRKEILDERAQLKGNLEAERSAAEAAREAERHKSGQVDSLTADLERTQQRIQELETAVQRKARLASEGTQAEALALASTDIERMLRALGEGNLINARQVGSELASNAAVLAAPIPLIPFFEDLFEAHDDLAALDSRSDPFERASMLEPAAASIERATLSGQPTMTRDNASLLLDDPARIAAYRAVLKSMDERLEGHKLGLRQEFRDIWAATLADPDLAPSQVLRRAATFKDQEDRLREFVRGYARFIEEHALSYDVLDLDKLNEISSLEAWKYQLEGDPVDGLERETELLTALSFARQFYGAEELSRIPRGLRVSSSSEAWRERLSIAAAVLDHEQGMRARIGTRLLYHTRTEAGEESWRWDTVQEDLNPPPGVDDSRVILQEFYDRDGNKSGKRSVRLYRIGLQLYEGDTRPIELINLAIDGPAYSIYPWHAAEEPLPPARLLVSPGAYEAFRARLKHEEWRAFVVEEGRQSTLWTRELGLVRHSIPGRISFELVYAEFP